MLPPGAPGTGHASAPHIAHEGNAQHLPQAAGVAAARTALLAALQQLPTALDAGINAPQALLRVRHAMAQLGAVEAPAMVRLAEALSWRSSHSQLITNEVQPHEVPLPEGITVQRVRNLYDSVAGQLLGSQQHADLLRRCVVRLVERARQAGAVGLQLPLLREAVGGMAPVGDAAVRGLQLDLPDPLQLPLMALAEMGVVLRIRHSAAKAGQQWLHVQLGYARPDALQPAAKTIYLGLQQARAGSSSSGNGTDNAPYALRLLLPSRSALQPHGLADLVDADQLIRSPTAAAGSWLDAYETAYFQYKHVELSTDDFKAAGDGNVVVRGVCTFRLNLHRDPINSSTTLELAAMRRGGEWVTVCRVPAVPKQPQGPPAARRQPTPSGPAATEQADEEVLAAQVAAFRLADTDPFSEQMFMRFMGEDPESAMRFMISHARTMLQVCNQMVSRQGQEADPGTGPAAASTPYQQQLLSLIRGLTSKMAQSVQLVAPRTTAVAGEPDAGKSSLCNFIIALMAPPGLADSSLPAEMDESEVLIDSQLREEDTSGAELAALTSGLLHYDAALTLPHLRPMTDANHPWYSRSERRGPLPLGAHNAVSGVAVKCVPAADANTWVVELRLKSPAVAVECMAQAEAAEQALQQEAEKGEEAEGGGGAGAGRDLQLRHPKLDEACAMLGVPYVSALPVRTARRVPMAFAQYSVVRFTLNARHPGAVVMVNRIMRRFTCTSNWGLVESAVLYYPSRLSNRTVGCTRWPGPTLLDPAGLSKSLTPYRYGKAMDALEQEPLAGMVIVSKDGREPGTGLIAGLMDAGLPARMGPRQGLEVPLHVVYVRNMGKGGHDEDDEKETAPEAVLHADAKTAYHELLPIMIDACKVPDADKQVMRQHAHSQPLFMKAENVGRWLVDPQATDLEEYRLQVFVERLLGIEQAAHTEFALAKMRHLLSPAFRACFEAANEVVRTMQVAYARQEVAGGEHDVVGDGVMDVVCGQMMSADVEGHIMARLRLMAMGGGGGAAGADASGGASTSAAPAPPPEPQLNMSAALEPIRRAVTSPEVGSPMHAAMQACSQAAVRLRITAAREARNAGDPVYPLVRPGNRNLITALMLAPGSTPLPQLLLGDLWATVVAEVVAPAEQRFTEALQAGCQAACARFKEVIASARASAGQNMAADMLLSCCEHQYLLKAESGTQDVERKLRMALPELATPEMMHRVYEDVMGPSFKSLVSLERSVRQPNQHRLDTMASWTPGRFANPLVERLLWEVEVVWHRHLDMWLARCQQAWASQAAIARGVLSGDADQLEHSPMFSVCTILQRMCAEALSALRTAGVLSGQEKLEELWAQVQLVLDEQDGVMMTAAVASQVLEQHRALPELPQPPAAAAAAGNLAAAGGAGPAAAAPAPAAAAAGANGTTDWHCPVCGCSQFECPVIMPLTTRWVRGAPWIDQVLPGGTAVCRACNNRLYSSLGHLPTAFRSREAVERRLVDVRRVRERSLACLRRKRTAQAAQLAAAGPAQRRRVK